MTVVRRRRGILGACIAMSGVAVLLVGCGGSPASGEGAGEGAGEVVVVCGATEEWCAANVEGFTEATGIAASYVRLSSGEAAARLEAGKASPEFDVWHGGPADGYIAAAERGLLEPYESPNAAAIPDKYKSPDGTWTGVYVGVLGFCSNSAVLASKGLQTPDSWADLLQPGFAKQVSVAHPSTSGTGFTALWTQVSRAGGDPAAGLDYMHALRPSLLQFTKSGVGPVQQVGRGEIATGIVFSHDCVRSQEEGFSDLVVSFPSEGTGYEIGGVAAIKNARHPEAARAYIDWALTAPAQEIGATVGSYQLPTHPDAAVSGKSAKLDELALVDYDFAAAGAAKSDLVRQFNEMIATPPAS